MKNIIEVRNLIAKYGTKTILNGINVNFQEGEITVILGGSGCGKSTLLKNVLRMYQPHSGLVKIFGKEVTSMEEKEYNKILSNIGMLFQNGALLNSINVYENIYIPLEQHTDLPKEIIDKIIKVKLDLVNMSHAINLFPSELSGGMVKRVALARAIALDPKILFCDEPSAGLDPLTSASLDKLIINLKNRLNMSIIVVTHELASISRIADKIIFLHEGKMLFNGTLSEAVNSGIKEVETFFSTGKIEL